MIFFPSLRAPKGEPKNLWVTAPLTAARDDILKEGCEFDMLGQTMGVYQIGHGMPCLYGTPSVLIGNNLYANYDVFLNFKAITARVNQAIMKQRPPSGVMGPKIRGPSNARA